MSDAFRTEITALLEDVNEILANPKAFALPPAGDNQAAQIRTLLTQLNIEEANVQEIASDLSTAHNGWNKLRTNMTGAERLTDNVALDAFAIAHPYIDPLNRLRRYLRVLRTARVTLEAAMPAPSLPISHTHLPKLTLPKFDGNCAEFPSFWNQFMAAIGNLLNISDAIKLVYLKECLSNAPLSLIDALPISDPSYAEASRLLNAKYNNPEEIARNLHQALKILQPIRKGELFCADLAKFIDAIEAICAQLTQNDHDPNVLYVQIEIESKLPGFLLEDVYRMKEKAGPAWNTENLRDALKMILKRKQNISVLHQ